MSEKTPKRKFLLWALRFSTALLGTLGWILIEGSITGQQYEYAIHDTLIRMRGPVKAPQDVMVLALDEESFRQLELPLDRPLPRKYHGEILERLASLGAKRVVFDIVFAGQSASPEGDQALAKGVASLPVVLAVDHGVRESGGMVFHELIKPEPFLSDHAVALATVGMQLDSGTARRFYIDRDDNIKEFVSLSEAGAGYNNSKDLANAVLPDPSDLINFYGPAQSLRTISLYQLLEKEVPIPESMVKDKVIYVGLVLRTGLGAAQKDIFPTTFGNIFGVEIHATQASNLIHKNWINRPSLNTELMIGSVVLFGFLMILLRAKPVTAGTLLVAIVIGWFVAATICVYNNFFLTGVSAVTIIMPLAVIVSTTYWYITTRKRQAQIEKAFSLYVAPAMVSELKRNPNLLKLGGEEIVASAMFTDIAGFTSISEPLGAVRVTAMLNSYFTDVSKAVMDEGGTVIKFIGDAVFAIWGAPVPQEDHAARACRAAMRLQETVENFNKKGEYPPLVTRVGVNTGKMMVGNLGSDKRFDYTAIGDAVNLSSRIEGVNKYLGTTVLVTDDALKSSNGQINGSTLRMGAIRVVGKEIPVNLFRLTSEEVKPEVSDYWNRSLASFTARKWSEAVETFTKVKEIAPELTIASDLYLSIIEEYQTNPPPARWQGEIVMDHK